MSERFKVVDATHWEVIDVESVGRNPKLWLREPGGTNDRQRDWLFKPVVVPANGHQQGEDWSEKVVAEIGRLIGLPCAEVDLAQRSGRPGLLSRNVVPPGWSLELGPVLLSRFAEGYRAPVMDESGRPHAVRGRPGHTVENIFRALSGCESPRGPSDGSVAVETFAGYLLLDAWVANQDRHDQNWGALRPPAGPLRLAPSFDHASSLGFNLTDSRRATILSSGGMAKFAERGRAHRFEHDPSAPSSAICSLVELAHRGMAIVGDRTSDELLGQLRAVELADVTSVIARVPELSEVKARFILGAAGDQP